MWQRLARLVAFGAAAIAAAAQAALPMTLGVSTHFDHGWPISLTAQVDSVQARAIRDGLSWAKGEPQAGRYDFSDGRTAFLRKTCAARGDVLLVFDPRNPAYDGGDTVYTPRAQAAFAAYVAAVLDRFPGCIAAIEIGNEINAGMHMPAGVDQPRAYVGLLRAVKGAIRDRHPKVIVVGGSTNVIGTGFLETLFAAGGLATMDAVAVHPYRPFPENVDVELARLNAAMARHGGAKPIWATEVGEYFKAPEFAPPYLVKMTMLLAAAGVQRSYWYALVDEPWFPNMGLFDPQHRAKPAADAFRLAVETLLAGGPPVRVSTGDRRSFVFRLASGGQVIWGAPRRIEIISAGYVRDSRGRAIPPPQMLSADPVVLPAGAKLTLGPSEVVADSLYEFAAAPWSYLAQTDRAAPVPLAMTDWQWTSHYTARGLNPLEINAASLATAGDGRRPLRAVVRYTSPSAQSLLVSACFTKKDAGGWDRSARDGDGAVAVQRRRDRPDGDRSGCGEAAGGRNDRLQLRPEPQRRLRCAQLSHSPAEAGVAARAGVRRMSRGARGTRRW